MNIKKLKEIIKDLPDNMEVFIDERLTEFKYGLVNSAIVKEIGFQEEPNGKTLAKQTVFILKED